VRVDDGSPLPANVNIQSVCASKQRTVANTSSGGSFGFVWGNSGGVFEDASENVRNPGISSSSGLSGSDSGSGSAGGGGRAIDPLADCELRADAPGYTSSKVSLYQHADR
jgi:hypothetical protein